MLISFFSGLLASSLHVLSGPDHLAAVTPLVFEEKKNKHYRIGLFWGVGHVLGMLLIGILFFLFKESFDVEWISSYSEKIVGFILIIMGLWFLYRLKFPKKTHVHPHLHRENGKEIFHIHSHEHTENKKSHEHKHEKLVQTTELSSMGIGIIHGFAGVSHLILMLPVLGFSTKTESALYLTGFAVGTIVSMGLYTFVLGKFEKISKLNINVLKFAGAFFALIVGIYWITLN